MFKIKICALFIIALFARLCVSGMTFFSHVETLA